MFDVTSNQSSATCMVESTKALSAWLKVKSDRSGGWVDAHDFTDDWILLITNCMVNIMLLNRILTVPTHSFDCPEAIPSNGLRTHPWC